jgi:hypothetical protein
VKTCLFAELLRSNFSFVVAYFTVSAYQWVYMPQYVQPEYAISDVLFYAQLVDKHISFENCFGEDPWNLPIYPNLTQMVLHASQTPWCDQF